MPVKDGSNSRARLVDGGCVSFENRRSRKICKANKGQEIAVQTWRIPSEKRNILYTSHSLRVLMFFVINIKYRKVGGDNIQNSAS